MSDQEAAVFEAISRGRLIFPFRDELSALKKQAQAGPLTDDEQERLSELQGAFQIILTKDKWFHSAMVAGDTDTALKVAEEALKVCQELS